MSRPPVLIICHTFPPYRGIGGRRWAKFAKALAAQGRMVHVVHSGGPASLHGSLWTHDVEAAGIVRHPLPQRYPTVLFKRPLTSVLEKLAYRFWTVALPLLVKGNWLDKAVLWENQLVRTCSSLIKEHGIRAVVVTGAPFRLMVHALQLKRLHPGIRLTADFRDPWTWTHEYGTHILTSQRLAAEMAFEQAVVNGFDRIITPASSIADQLQRTYGGASDKYAVVPHAIDPDDLSTSVELTKDGLFRILYAGSIYTSGEFQKYLAAVINAFKLLAEVRPDLAARTRFDLHITGDGTSTFTRMVDEAGLSGNIAFHPPLPLNILVAHLRRADLVMVFLPDDRKDFVSTKFSELFHLRVPVLHVGAEGHVSRTLEQRGLGRSVRLMNLDKELLRIVSGSDPVIIDRTTNVDDLLLASVTERLERIIDPAAGA